MSVSHRDGCVCSLSLQLSNILVLEVIQGVPDMLHQFLKFFARDRRVVAGASRWGCGLANRAQLRRSKAATQRTRKKACSHVFRTRRPIPSLSRRSLPRSGGLGARSWKPIGRYWALKEILPDFVVHSVRGMGAGIMGRQGSTSLYAVLQCKHRRWELLVFHFGREMRKAPLSELGW